MLENRHSTIVRRNMGMFVLALLVLLLVLAACGGAKEAPLSQQAPPRRGGVDVEAQVQDIVAQVLDVPATEVTASADLRKDLGADDAKMQALAAALEKAFDIDISAADIDGLTTVGSVVDLVKSKL